MAVLATFTTLRKGTQIDTSLLSVLLTTTVSNKCIHAFNGKFRKSWCKQAHMLEAQSFISANKKLLLELIGRAPNKATA